MGLHSLLQGYFKIVYLLLLEAVDLDTKPRKIIKWREFNMEITEMGSLEVSSK
jgi:hypothetical protein